MICVPAPPALMRFTDTFNRADNADLGANWRVEQIDAAKIATNRAQRGTPASFTGRHGAWESYVPTSDYNGGRLLTDNWSIEVPLIAPVGSAATDNYTSFGAGMFDGGPAAGMVLVYFTLATQSGTLGGRRIVSLSGSAIPGAGQSTGQTGQTIRATSSTATVMPATARFERRMYSATQSVFTSYIGGVVDLIWDDIGGVVPAGALTRRRWFIQVEGNVPIATAFYSPALDSVTAQDIKG